MKVRHRYSVGALHDGDLLTDEWSRRAPSRKGARLIRNRQPDEPVPELPKEIKRLVREWAGIAHDRDLRKALSELRVQFDRWDGGEIDSFELNELVHRFHQFTAREIWKRYATTHLEPAVASAVVAGVLRKEELPAQLVQHLAGLIEFYEQDLPPT
jgi:hypothetical protein